VQVCTSSSPRLGRTFGTALAEAGGERGGVGALGGQDGQERRVRAEVPGQHEEVQERAGG